MADTSPNLPSTERDDAAEVVLALETARTLWFNGQGLESVRWIQRAAENAESSGNDLRAVSLARAAADLRAEVGVTWEPAAPINEAAALTSFDDFSEQTIVDAPAMAQARQAFQSSPQLSAPLFAPVLVLELPSAGATPPLAPVITPAIAAATEPAVTPTVTPPAEHQTLRVAVVAQDPLTRELTLRVLGQGETAPAGSTEALLVSLHAEQRLSP